jgi:hypothetical protein
MLEPLPAMVVDSLEAPVLEPPPPAGGVVKVQTFATGPFS